mgnify:CR=1 FL=1|tara:strand:- start:182 stop:1048 length:867 start_codon:yes stop_codon:yes gene_type:complete
MIIVGLGKAGCSLAKTFSKFPQYETYGIDTTDDADITIRAKNSHEEYDTKFPNLKRKLKFTDEDVLLIVSGSGRISGGTLCLLEQLNNNRISVLYVQGDISIMSEVQKMQEKIVSNVLQEYARSGLLEKIILVSNSMLEQSIGDMSIIGYYDTLNQAVVNTVHMMNVFEHTEPIIGNFIQPAEISRICTVGIVDIEVDEDEEEVEKWFYDLTEPRDVVYYYGISEDDLKNDGTLFRKINNFVKSRIEDGVNVSYGVFKTIYDQKYCYCIKYSSMVQSYKELLDDQEIS